MNHITDVQTAKVVSHEKAKAPKAGDQRSGRSSRSRAFYRNKELMTWWPEWLGQKHKEIIEAIGHIET